MISVTVIPLWLWQIWWFNPFSPTGVMTPSLSMSRMTCSTLQWWLHDYWGHILVAYGAHLAGNFCQMAVPQTTKMTSDASHAVG